MFVGEKNLDEIPLLLTWARTWQLHQFLKSPYGVYSCDSVASQLTVSCHLSQHNCRGLLKVRPWRHICLVSSEEALVGLEKLSVTENPFELGNPSLLSDSFPLTRIVFICLLLMQVLIHSKLLYKEPVLSKTGVMSEMKRQSDKVGRKLFLFTMSLIFNKFLFHLSCCSSLPV